MRCNLFAKSGIRAVVQIDRRCRMLIVKVEIMHRQCQFDGIISRRAKHGTDSSAPQLHLRKQKIRLISGDFAELESIVAVAFLTAEPQIASVVIIHLMPLK